MITYVWAQQISRIVAMTLVLIVPAVVYTSRHVKVTDSHHRGAQRQSAVSVSTLTQIEANLFVPRWVQWLNAHTWTRFAGTPKLPIFTMTLIMHFFVCCTFIAHWIPDVSETMAYSFEYTGLPILLIGSLIILYTNPLSTAFLYCHIGFTSLLAYFL